MGGKISLAKNVAPSVWPRTHPDLLAARRAFLLGAWYRIELGTAMRAIGPVVLVHRQTDYGPRTRACAPAHDEQIAWDWSGRDDRRRDLCRYVRCRPLG